MASCYALHATVKFKKHKLVSIQLLLVRKMKIACRTKVADTPHICTYKIFYELGKWTCCVSLRGNLHLNHMQLLAPCKIGMINILDKNIELSRCTKFCLMKVKGRRVIKLRMYIYSQEYKYLFL